MKNNSTLNTNKLKSNARKKALSNNDEATVISNLDKLLKLPKQYWVMIISFLPIQDIISNVNIVSRYFHEVCNSAILWQNLCIRDFTWKSITLHVPEIKPNDIEKDWFKLYFILYFECCYGCKDNKVDSTDICPVEKRPLCKQCRLKGEFKLLTLTEIKTEYGVVVWNIFENSFRKFSTNYKGEKMFYKRYVDRTHTIFRSIMS